MKSTEKTLFERGAVLKIEWTNVCRTFVQSNSFPTVEVRINFIYEYISDNRMSNLKVALFNRKLNMIDVLMFRHCPRIQFCAHIFLLTPHIFSIHVKTF